MADSSRKTVTQLNEGGSSKLELPTTQKRGSSVTVKPKSGEKIAKSQSAGLITEQPTAISKKPPIVGTGLSSSALRVRSLEGADLQQFHLEKYVGGGGMGAVFRGTDTTLGRTVAVKVLSQDLVDDDVIRRFRHEAESAAKLDHPAIPHVYYVGEHDGWYFIAFEYVDGENIRDFVGQQGPLSIPQAVIYLADIADALQHASSRDVVHRDVKPSNVLITNDGYAKLVDMGLARSEQIQSTANDLTATGVTLGTFDYISPEQARDPRNVDTRSDIYSLGCTLYFMLTGQPPFPMGTMLQKLLSHTSESPPDPSDFRQDIPPRLTELLARMLAKNPDHRHQDAGELLGEILLLAEEQKITLNSTRQSKIVIERPIIQETGLRRHVPWLVPLVVLVSTALALHFWQIEPSQPALISGDEVSTEVVVPDVESVVPDVESASAIDQPYTGTPQLSAERQIQEAGFTSEALRSPEVIPPSD